MNTWHCALNSTLALSSVIDAPLDTETRVEYIRVTLSILAMGRGYWRLASAIRYADTTRLGTILLGLADGWRFHGWDPMSDLERDTRSVMKLVACSESHHGRHVLEDETFLRICSLAGDVYSWDESPSGFADEYEAFVRPAWLALTDEVEYELEESSVRLPVYVSSEGV